MSRFTWVLLLGLFLIGPSKTSAGEPPKERLDAQIQRLLDQLRDRDEKVRKDAVAELALLGEPAQRRLVSGLRVALHDPSETIRVRAAQTLREIGPGARTALDDLIGALRDESREVRLWAIRALGAIGPTAGDAVPDLIPLLKDKDQDVRWTAIQALGWPLGGIGPQAREAVPDLIVILKGKDTSGDPNTFPKIAADALGAIGPDARAAIPLLLEKVEDSNRPVEDRFRYSVPLRQILTPSDKEVLPKLLALLRSDKEKLDIRLAAALALGSLGSTAGDAVPDMLALLKQEIKRDRTSNSLYLLMQALAKIGPPAKETAPVLLSLLADRDASNAHRMIAAEALGKIGIDSKEVLEGLKTAASTDPHDPVRRQARIALWRLQDRK